MVSSYIRMLCLICNVHVVSNSKNDYSVLNNNLFIDGSTTKISLKYLDYF